MGKVRVREKDLVLEAAGHGWRCALGVRVPPPFIKSQGPPHLQLKVEPNR